MGASVSHVSMSTNPSASMRVQVSSGVAYTFVAARSIPAARSAAVLTRSRLPHPPHCAANCPRGRITAARFANSRSWSGTQWKVAVDKIASTRSIGIGSRRSCVRYVIRSAPSRSTAAAIIEGDASSAITWPRGSRSRSAWVTCPVPQPASRIVSSPRRRRRSRTSNPHPVMGMGRRSYVAASQSCGTVRPAYGGPGSAATASGLWRYLVHHDVDLGVVRLRHRDHGPVTADDALVAQRLVPARLIRQGGALLAVLARAGFMIRMRHRCSVRPRPGGCNDSTQELRPARWGAIDRCRFSGPVGGPAESYETLVSVAYYHRGMD